MSLWDRFQEYRARRRYDRIKEKYENGYNLAAGELLRGKPQIVVESWIGVRNRDEFDCGIRDAIYDWGRHTYGGSGQK